MPFWLEHLPSEGNTREDERKGREEKAS